LNRPFCRECLVGVSNVRRPLIVRATVDSVAISDGLYSDDDRRMHIQYTLRDLHDVLGILRTRSVKVHSHRMRCRAALRGAATQRTATVRVSPGPSLNQQLDAPRVPNSYKIALAVDVRDIHQFYIMKFLGHLLR